MKLISLNLWDGYAPDSLLSFIKNHAGSTDIFCFQEVYSTTSGIKRYGDIQANLFEEINNLLPNYLGFFDPVVKGYNMRGGPPGMVDFDLEWGEALFLKKDLTVYDQGSHLIYKEPGSEILKNDFSNLSTYLQFIKFSAGDKIFTVYNFHGAPEPGSKLDTTRRIDQSNKILELIRKEDAHKILVGDFNLLPDTRSVHILEREMKNLIKEFNIKKTRSRLSPYFNTPEFQLFADYTFVTDGVVVNSFAVPDIEISDHLPMILEFS